MGSLQTPPRRMSPFNLLAPSLGLRVAAGMSVHSQVQFQGASLIYPPVLCLTRGGNSRASAEVGPIYRSWPQRDGCVCLVGLKERLHGKTNDARKSITKYLDPKPLVENDNSVYFRLLIDVRFRFRRCRWSRKRRPLHQNTAKDSSKYYLRLTFPFSDKYHLENRCFTCLRAKTENQIKREERGRNHPLLPHTY